MIKLHLFKGFENKRLGIKSNTELGHLYSDKNDFNELLEAVTIAGWVPNWMQRDKYGFTHMDLWGEPLRKAKEKFKIATGLEMYNDMKRVQKK